MNRNKAIAYSLLAHVRNTATLIQGPLDIFVPLIKRALSQMNTNNHFSGKSISEINEYAKKLYSIDFPIPVLRSILEIIVREVDKSRTGAFTLHQDNSFSIANYTFTEFDETVRKRQQEISRLEELFQDFCGKTKCQVKDSTSIFTFLEKNKLNLSKHLSHTESLNGKEYLVEAQFVDYFRHIPPVYELLKSLYLGSILSEYLEFTISDAKMNVELLLDTNFIISLMDLNTPESTLTCNTLINIAKKQGYSLSILEETIEEIKFLLRRKSEYFDKSFFEKKIYSEDIYNACERRNLTKIDLEKIIDNIESEIQTFGIITIKDIGEIKKEALKSHEYKYYKEKRANEISARHDAIAIYYVRNKRCQAKFKDFTDVNCWFVNNAISRDYIKSPHERAFQPDIIKADDLLSILWLSNPQINQLVNPDEIADIGLSSLISLTFTESLPKVAVIKELEDNIQKYAAQKITNEDIIKVATRITTKQLTNIEELNTLAKEEDKEPFIKKLEEEAKKQSKEETERIKALKIISEKFMEGIESVEKIKQSDKNKEKRISELARKADETNSENRKLKQELEKEKKKQEINTKIQKWQLYSRLFVLVACLISILILFFFIDFIKEQEPLWISVEGFISAAIWGVILKLVYDRHWNHSNIENYKKSLE